MTLTSRAEDTSPYTSVKTVSPARAVARMRASRSASTEAYVGLPPPSGTDHAAGPCPCPGYHRLCGAKLTGTWVGVSCDAGPFAFGCCAGSGTHTVVAFGPSDCCVQAPRRRR
jgi:hypothetical protein